MTFITFIQDRLDFQGCSSPQFATKRGLGRVGLIAAVLGVSLGFHLCIFVSTIVAQRDQHLIYENNEKELEKRIVSEPSSLVLILQLWSLYIICLSCFHMSEFFITATYNPTAVTADSFVVNQSEKYTVAVLVCSSCFLSLSKIYKVYVCFRLPPYTWANSVLLFVCTLLLQFFIVILWSFHSWSFG